MGTNMAIRPGLVRQAAAIPVLGNQVCLVTSRNGKRLVIPKGCLEPGKTSGEIALQEAWEEAGLVGLLQADPIGSYLYEKDARNHHVLVYLMQVTQVAEVWPEGAWRARSWHTFGQALRRVEEVGLREILRGAVAFRENAASPKLQEVPVMP
jgi:8-oxo-dGTP pyrophosphatase MutT (NUDIX family)